MHLLQLLKIFLKIKIYNIIIILLIIILYLTNFTTSQLIKH